MGLFLKTNMWLFSLAPTDQFITYISPKFYSRITVRMPMPSPKVKWRSQRCRQHDHSGDLKCSLSLSELFATKDVTNALQLGMHRRPHFSPDGLAPQRRALTVLREAVHSCIHTPIHFKEYNCCVLRFCRKLPIVFCLVGQKKKS